ncbi:MAG TPA: CbiX/SirB N-terminal domain-containing protein [Tepidisphaeraceae bacterium]|nr:CbiX/SirB N-terminal domain-containing protein [Tepidisphaeraceae bacterium]
MKTGIIIVDHGSRRTESNRMLEEVAALFGERFRQSFEVVEPAHMELCEPSIATAYARCVARGATNVVVCPFFLGPGKHWTTDIPRLTAEAAEAYPGTRYHVTMPLGIDELILELLNKRASHCVGNGLLCDGCRGSIRSGEPGVVVPKPEHHAAPAVAQVQCSSCPFEVRGNAVVDKRKVGV